jgi:methylenetetrahydrofolate reductase (NADPH)
MFFDNQKYFKFVAACREAGITVPIIPGLKVLRSAAQLKTLPKAFHIDLPDGLVDEVMENPQHAAEIGRRWTQKQSEELINGGAPSLHYYVLNDAQHVCEIVRNLRK